MEAAHIGSGFRYASGQVQTIRVLEMALSLLTRVNTDQSALGWDLFCVKLTQNSQLLSDPCRFDARFNQFPTPCSWATFLGSRFSGIYSDGPSRLMPPVTVPLDAADNGSGFRYVSGRVQTVACARRDDPGSAAVTILGD